MITNAREPGTLNPRYYDIIAGIFVAVLLITQTIAQKIVPFGSFNFSAGVILFPISYIFGDILTEVYGYEKSRRVIWIGFFCSGLMAFVYSLAVILPASSGWANQEAFEKVLGQVPRIVIGSLVAYWAGEFSNSYVLSKMKILTKGKYLWTRTIGSTIVGEAVDTFVVMFIAFYGVLDISLLLSVAFSIYIFKVVYEVVATPITYIIVRFLKRKEGVDIYDIGISYNPFKISEKILS